MKNIRYSVLIILVLFLNISLFSQSNIVVKYTYIESLNEPDANMTSFNAGLYIKKDKSIFVTQIDSLENGGKRIAKTIKTKGGGIMAINTSSSKDGFYTIIDREKDTLYANTEFNNKFIYKEKAPKMVWNITNKTKKIDGIKVQKATIHFRGRNYIAWFAPEIPVSLGPWKLNGLPGLIIEAYDVNKELLFLFKKLEIPYRKAINFPTLNRKWHSFGEYLKEQDSHIERNLKYVRSIASEFGGQPTENEEENLRNGMFIELFKKN